MTVQAPEPPLVEVRAATLGYPEREILRNVDLEVRRGDFLAVVGPNGAGKTTVLRTILGVLRPLRGACVARGTLGYAPQRSVLDPIYPLTSAEVVAMGLLAGVGVREEAAGLVERALAACGAGRLAPALDDLAKTDGLVERALAACGMAAHSRTQFRDLSGGQKQRVLVARALVSEPDVLILDEPTNDLDLRGEHEVMELVRSLHEGGRTVVMVSHMLHVVARYARRIAFIHGGGLVAGDLDGMLTSARLEPLYGMPVVVGEVAGHRAVAPGRPGTPAPPASPAPRAEPPAPARGEAATTPATTSATTPAEPDEAPAAAAAPEPDEAAAGLDELRSEARSWRLVAVGLCALACLAIWSGAGERRGRVEALERLNEASRLRADEARESAELVRSLDAQVSAADRDLEALERGRSLAELQTSEARQALERARGERLRADAAAADALAAAEGRLAARGDELAAIGSRLLAAEQARDQAQRARDQAERARVERSDALERDLAALRDQLGAATAAGARAREEAAALRAALDAARADGLARATALTLELERQRGAVAALESQLRLAAERPGAGEPPPLELEPPDPGGS